MSDFSLCIKAAAAMKEAGESGILLTAGTAKPNAMTIGWCTEGVMWGRPVICVPVRQTRYTHDILEKETAFTVFVPKKRSARVVSYFGTVSGRDEDKLLKAGMKTAPSPYVSSPMITEKGCVIHAKILYKINMSDKNMSPEVKEWYSKGESKDNFHTLYFGEIAAVTQNE